MEGLAAWNKAEREPVISYVGEMGITLTSRFRGRTTAHIEGVRTLALVGLCLLTSLLATPLRPGIVLGESMSPTFRSGQVFLMSQLRSPTLVSRGDVVLFELSGQSYLKRVYAVAGDVVWGVAMPEGGGTLSQVVPVGRLLRVRDYLASHPYAGELMQVEVPPGEVFVLGDAGADSYDSRVYGPVPVSAVRGRVIVPHLFSLWAPAEAGGALFATGQAASSDPL